MPDEKPFVYTPDEDTMKIVGKVFGMRISVDALVAALEEERANIRGTVSGLLSDPAAFLFNFISPKMLGLSKDDKQNIPAELKSGELLAKLNGELAKSIESVRAKIDGLALTDLSMQHFEGVADEWRKAIVLKILDIATKQAFDLVDLDPERDAYLLHGAKAFIYKQLGFPRLQ